MLLRRDVAGRVLCDVVCVPNRMLWMGRAWLGMGTPRALATASTPCLIIMYCIVNATVLL